MRRVKVPPLPHHQYYRQDFSLSHTSIVADQQPEFPHKFQRHAIASIDHHRSATSIRRPPLPNPAMTAEAPVQSPAPTRWPQLPRARRPRPSEHLRGRNPPPACQLLA